MPSRKLEDTSHLLQLYLYHIGKSEVPIDFHVWAFFSMMAASVGNRVWYEKMKGKKLVPNLYTFLVGPSGCGKGEAIDDAMKFVADIDRVNMYAGVLTAQYLLKKLGHAVSSENGVRRVENTCIYLNNPELAMSLPHGEQGDAIINHLTEMYTGRPYPIMKGTVSQGAEYKISDYAVNWIAGTTQDALRTRIPSGALFGGLFGRLIIVRADYDFEKRYPRPEYPNDYDEVVAHLHNRVRRLTFVEGPFTMTGEARECDDQWYTGREAPGDPIMAPAWRREHDLVLKLAMLFSLCESYSLVIERHHVSTAQRYAALAMKWMPSTIADAATTPETAGLTDLEGYVARLKRVPHSMVLSFAANRGMNAERVRNHMVMLMQMGRVGAAQQGGRGVVYTWKGRGKR